MAMRDQSLSLRILVLAVLLLAATALCVFALVVIGALHPRVTYMVAAGGVILIVAILASAISALGPKYRPTPLLTPLFAGVFAAMLTSTVIYAVQAHVATKRSAVAAVAPGPAKTTQVDKPNKVAKAVAEPTATAPILDKTAAAPTPPAAPQAPAPAAVPRFDAADFAPAPFPSADQLLPATQPAAATDGQPATMNATDTPMVDPTKAAATDAPTPDTAGGAEKTKLIDVADVAASPAKAAEKPAAGGKKAVVGEIPVPAAAPQAKKKSAQPVNLSGGFDTSGPVAPQAAGPPMALDAADAALPHHVAIPPLPRIRPCGGAGPACP